MRVKDIIYFSPKYSIQSIDFNDKVILIDAFCDRIENYYIKPAQGLNSQECAFAAGVMLMTTIEAISAFTLSGAVSTKIKKFCLQIPDISKQKKEYQDLFAEKVWTDFRNGLVHEGRIKNGSQFCYDYPFLEIIDADCLILNPKYLSSEVESYFAKILEQLKTDTGAYSIFKQRFSTSFQDEIERLR